MAGAVSEARAQVKEVTIAHQDMVIPFRVAQAAGAVEKATGYKINWKLFGGGGDVIKAMASGDVPIGEVGSSPATAAAAQGLDIEIVWILDDINNAEQLVVTDKSDIKDLAGLKGKKVATPLASTSHYQLLFALKNAGVSAKDVQILNLRPPEIAAAWERGDIDAAFIWDPVLSKIKAGGGKVILSSADVAKLGAPTFDALIVNKGWAEKNKEFVSALVGEFARADAAYRADRAAYTKESDQVRAIAKVVGAVPADVPGVLESYGFPTAAEQASNTWLGGGKDSGAAKALANTAVFLKEQGRITDVPPDFARFVNPNYAAAAR
jgi:taurine transport system substrate-binding protein